MANNATIGGLTINLTELSADTSPQLGGNLDLNSNDITGTGDINTTGTVTASGTITGATFSGSGASLTSIPSAQLTGALPAIDGSSLTGINTDLVDDTTPQLGGNLDAQTNNITNLGTINTHTVPSGTGTLALTSDITLTTSSTDTFTNKTINLSNNTLSGTAAQFNTALSDGSFKVSGSYSTGEVIEELHAVCNGTDLHGRATIQNVTGSYTIGESYGDATGSVVTSYTPPSGTKMIVYEYTAHLRWSDAHAISHWRLYYQVSGGTWTEVTKARTNRNGYYPEDKQILRWVFEVDAASDDSTLGIFNAATPQLGFKWQTRDYGTSNERGFLHLTQYWDGSGTDVYSQPMIMIKAIA